MERLQDPLKVIRSEIHKFNKPLLESRDIRYIAQSFV